MEKGKISSLQMAMMIYATTISTAMISTPGLVAKYAKNDFWMSPILASLIGFVTVYIVCELHKLYPKQTVIEYSTQIVGRIPGKIIGLLIPFFCLMAAGHMLRDYSEFLLSAYLPRTPISVIITSMILLSAFAVNGGIEVIGRLAHLFSPFFILPFIIFVFLLFPDFEIKNIFPILGNGVIPPIKGSILETFYGEFFLFTFLLPYLSDVKKARKYGMMTVFAIMLTLVVLNLTVIFILGPTAYFKNFPLMIAIRQIHLADFVENLESIAIVAWIIGSFLRITVFFYAAALSTAQWLNLPDYRVVIWPLAIIAVEFSFWSLPSTAEYAKYSTNVVPFYAPLVEMIIPLILLFIAIVRKKRKTQTDSM